MLLLLILVARVSAQTAPAEADAAIADATPHYSFEDGFLVARQGSRVVWNYPLAEANEPNSPAPLELDDRVYVCNQARLFALRASDGRVLGRWYVPGPCTALRGEDYTAIATCEGRDVPRWSFEFRTGFQRGDNAAMLSGPLALYATRRQAKDLRELRDVERAAASGQDPVVVRIRQLQMRMQQDPTNPWYAVEAAHYLHEHGRGEEGLRYAQQALAIPDLYAIDLLLAASTLDVVDPRIGEQAFAKGFRVLLEQGYQPELMRSLVTALGFLDRPGRDLDPQRDYAVLARHARRLAQLSPHLEGSTVLYAALADEANARHPDDREEFARLREQTRDDRYFLVATPEVKWAGDLLNVLFAGTLALIVLTLAKSTGRKAPVNAGRWTLLHPFARWTLSERLGLLIVSIVLPLIGWATALGVSEIGFAAAAPVQLASGNLGHPAALLATEAFAEAGDGAFIRAIALQQSGQLDDAYEMYGHLSSPEAQANRRTLEQGGSTHFAMPTNGMWNAAFRAQAQRDPALHNPFSATLSLTRTANQIAPEGTPFLPGAGAIALMLIFACGALLPPYPKRNDVAEKGRLQRVVEWIVPGASPTYGVFGFALLATWFTGILGVWFLITSNGEYSNVLDGIARLSYARYFGLAHTPMQHGLGAIELTYLAASVLYVLHLAWMIWGASSSESLLHKRT